MYELGLACDDPAERARWLQTAAMEGHAGAMYSYAQDCNDPKVRVAG